MLLFAFFGFIGPGTHASFKALHVFIALGAQHGFGFVAAQVNLAAAYKPCVLIGQNIAAFTTLPVIGIPINATPLNGMDSLLSFVQMPSGIPVATMAINGAKNAALFAVQILATKYPELVEKLAEDREKMKAEVKAKGEKLAALRASEQ